MKPAGETVGGRRGRGTRAGLDREQIVAAARSLDPQTLTMSAVAEHLGVDRKALNHHVSDRDGLLRLVATTTFDSYFAALEPTANGDWKTAVTTWATAVRDSVIATGALVDYFRLSSDGDDGALASADMVLRRLLEAGFDEEMAGRGLLLLAGIAVTFARDVVANGADIGQAQTPDMHRVLAESPADSYPALRHLIEKGQPSYDDTQFTFQLDVFVQGMEAKLVGR